MTTVNHVRKTPPRLWLLLGHKAGDNNQLIALAEGLGWPYQTQRMVYRPYELLTNRLLGVTLAGIKKHHSSVLQPPWPDCVLSAGRRNEPVARWIRQQSGGHTRIIHVGRPWAPLAAFDLIITTPQYFLPERPTILHIQLPLHRMREEQLQQQAQQWAATVSDLPKPYVAVMMGGNSGSLVLTTALAERIGQQLNQWVDAMQGSLLLSSSARTPPKAFAALLAQLTVPHHSYHWSPQAERNPYQAYLGLADTIAVTGDSMSMVTEASSTGKPVIIIDLVDHSKAWYRQWDQWRWRPLLYRLAMCVVPMRLRRDSRRLLATLIEAGAAVYLQPMMPDSLLTRPCLPSRDLDAAIKRVRELLQYGHL